MKRTNDCYKTKTIADGVTAINENGMVTMYLIEGSERALLLDTGWGIGDLAGLVQSLTDLPVEVMHTHGHIDHVSGAWQFENVLISNDDKYLLEQSYYREERLFHHDIMLSDYLKGDEAERWVNARPPHIKPVRPDYVFKIGNRQIVMITFPGHTRGSAVFLDGSNGLLFTGDSILEGTLWLHTEDSATLGTYLNSLNSLKDYQLKMLLPAHGKTPVVPDIIDEYVKGVQYILDGKLTGDPTQNHAGQGLLCQFQNNAIIYDPNKL